MSRGNAPRTGGGAATQTGINYQNRVAAWTCVRILAEQEVAPLWGLPADVTLEFIRCETEQPVDDILVGTSHGGHAFIQVKHTVTSSSVQDSALASTLEQFVRQFLAYRSEKIGKNRWERPLDMNLDRLVLVTSSRSSAPVTEHLPSALTRLRNLSPNQNIEEAAYSINQRKALAVVRSHLNRIWLNFTGTTLPQPDERLLLNLIWIQMLDVAAEERDEREAENILRSSIVKDHRQAVEAWNELVTACAGYAEDRSGADRAILQQQLVSSNIRIKAPPSYRMDIEKLKQHSDTTLQLLSDLSKICVGEDVIKIDRPSSVALRHAAEKQSIVVVGDPGSGKSGILHNLVDALIKETRDVVFFAVDKLEAKSLGELRVELGLEHELVEILRNWPGTEPALLVVDALDASRSESSAQTFYDLLAEVLRSPSRWRVIASIRKFDLRHNVRLHDLFTGRPPAEFQCSEFYNLYHLKVPLLNVEEWGQITQQSTELANLFVNASGNLRELLYMPFNVRLAGELLGSGVSVESLTPVETQIELLNRYWFERVIRHDHGGDAREALLTRALKAMVQTRSIRVNRREIVRETSDSEILRDILSSHVLSEWAPTSDSAANRRVLTFAHHMLFDYAIACLLLRGTEQSFIKQLEQDLDIVMAIRPSIVMHFQDEWLKNQDLFWDAVFRVIRSERIPEIGKLIGPTVAVESAKDLNGFDPMLRALASNDFNSRNMAEKSLRHVMGALMVKTTSSLGTLVGTSAPLWPAQLIDRCISEVRAATVYSVRPVLLMMCDHSENLTEQQRHFVGRAARRIFEFALAQEPRDSWLVISGLQAVCRTFASDSVVSAALLRRCLVPKYVLQFGHEELFRLANEIEHLITLDPSLVEDIYRTAFTFFDNSQDKTAIGGSRIMPMSSTRQQDFNMGRFVLGEKYEKFLTTTSFHATRALIVALKGYLEEQQDSRSPSRERIEESFEFNGRKASIRTDYSEIWDQNIAYREDTPLLMLEVFQSYLEQISSDEDKVGERRQILELIATENYSAVVWRRLLESGAKFPLTLGFDLRPLGWAIPILMSYDTTRVVGDYLTAVFGHLTLQERERIERAILSIPDSADEDWWGDAENVRNRLLGCLNRESIVTEEAKTILAQLDAENKVPANVPTFKSSFSSRTYTDEDYLMDQGVAVDEEKNRLLLTLSAPAKAFASKHLNTPPSLVEVEEIVSSLRTLHAALLTAKADEVHERVCDMAWRDLADACQSTAECEALSCEANDGSFVRMVLMEAATYPVPSPYPENIEHFDKNPSWSSPAARIDAAQGIVRLARQVSCADTALLEAVERLTRDEVPAVRFQVASRLNSLYHTAPDLMWSLLERISREEESREVLQGLLWGAIQPLATYHPDRITNCTRAIFERVRDGAGTEKVQDSCASIFVGLYLWQNQSVCAEIVGKIADNPIHYIQEANKIVFDLRSWLNIGPIESPNQEQNTVRQGSFQLMKRILESARNEIKALEAKNTTLHFNAWEVKDQEDSSNLARLIESICMQIYFASGAYKNSPHDDMGSSLSLGASERSRFFREAEGILELLSDFGYASLTHHLLQTLEYLIPYNPEKTFLLVGRVVHSGKQSGYQYESLAVDLIVRLVERFIAEFRHILKENEECRLILIEILDTFVKVGWASARRLSYRMEDIFL